MGPHWTKSWNVTTGCTPCSPACENCWAETMANRLPRSHGYSVDGKTPVPFSQIILHPDRLNEPFRWRKPQVVAVSFMGDLFHEKVPDDFIESVFRVMAQTPRHIYLLLTKRIDRAKSLFGNLPYWQNIAANHSREYPLSNLWFGTSAWDQESWDKNAEILKTIPATHRWVSLEPMLAPVEVGDLTGISWVVIGAESLGNRPGRYIDPVKIGDAERECMRQGVPVYVKQQVSEVGAIVNDWVSTKMKLFRFKPKARDLPPELARILIKENVNA